MAISNVSKEVRRFTMIGLVMFPIILVVDWHDRWKCFREGHVPGCSCGEHPHTICKRCGKDL